MTILEATVEIVKAALSTNTGAGISSLTNDKFRPDLIKGIDEVYNKLKELESKK